MLISMGMLLHPQAAGGQSAAVWARIDDFYARHFCIGATPESAELTRDERIACYYGAVGENSARKAVFDGRRQRCCFKSPIARGAIWAVGESVMTPIAAIEETSCESAAERPKLAFERATLADLLAVDARTGNPIPGVRVIISDASVHLVAYAKTTDEDGYAVIPTIASQPLVASLRRNGYLPKTNIVFRPPLPNASDDSSMHDSDQLSTEIVIELDPGTQLTGTVKTPLGEVAADAALHAEIRLSDGSIWYSDLDNPVPISALPGIEKETLVPLRAHYRTDERGRYRITPLPRGEATLYATHPDYAPSRPILVDARGDALLPPIELRLEHAHSAYLRAEDETGAAVAAAIYVFDKPTGAEHARYQTGTSGAILAESLPEHAKFYVFADGHAPATIEKTVRNGDEIVAKLRQTPNARYIFSVRDGSGSPIDNAVLLPAAPSIRKDFPQCRAKSQKDGTAVLEFCPSKFEVSAYHPNFAEKRMQAEFRPSRPDAVIPIELDAGLSFDLPCAEAKTHRPIRRIECEIRIGGSEQSDAGRSPREAGDIGDSESDSIERISTETGILRMMRRPNKIHRLMCKCPQGRYAEFSVDPSDPPAKLEFPALYAMQIVLCDAFGAPVAYGHIETPSQTFETDESGRAEILIGENGEAAFRHYLHGAAKKSAQELAEIRSAANGRPAEIRLPDFPDGEASACANRHNIKTLTDGAQIRVDDPGNYAQKGLMRGDSIEACGDRKLSVIRDGALIEIAI